MNTPLLTVYITNYNYGRYIKQAIESVLHQTFQDFELYIIDDGSTDDSRAIIETYSTHPQVKIIYQHNKGLNITNNIALRVSAGKYIIRLDADDYLHNDALEQMVSRIETNENIALVFPDYFIVDDNNHKTGVVRRMNFEKDVSLMDLPAHGACTLIRKDILVSIGGYDERYSCQDGYDLWIKLINNYKVSNINKPLFYYRRHQQNLTNNENRILKTRLNIKSDFCKTNNINIPSAIAVIPVRNQFIDGENLPLTKIGDQTILQRITKAALAAKHLQHVVITSADAEIKEYFQSHLTGLSQRLSFVERPIQFARLNETLSKTLLHVLSAENFSGIKAEAILTLAIEFPFITGDTIDDALNTLSIFHADSLISVRSDTKIYYQHVGNGLKPILGQEKFTQFEREALYKAVGGITVSTIDGFKRSGSMLNGKVGHIVIDTQQAMSVSNAFELKLASLLIKEENALVIN
jgi:CMP-N-acetylneuraminic acid synthetase